MSNKIEESTSILPEIEPRFKQRQISKRIDENLSHNNIDICPEDSVARLTDRDQKES